MSAIKIRFGSGEVTNLSNYTIYSSKDLVNFTSAEPNSDVDIGEGSPATYVTDENKKPIAVVTTGSNREATIFCYRYVYQGKEYIALGRNYSYQSTTDEISLPLFPDSTCTKTTAHLTPPNS